MQKNTQILKGLLAFGFQVIAYYVPFLENSSAPLSTSKKMFLSINCNLWLPSYWHYKIYFMLSLQMLKSMFQHFIFFFLAQQLKY